MKNAMRNKTRAQKLIVIILVFAFLLCVVGCSSVSEDSSQSDTFVDSEKNVIETNYFSLTVPEHWNGNYTYTIEDSWGSELDICDLDLSIYMTSSNEYSKAYLFSVYLLSLDDTEDIEIALDGWIEPVGVLLQGEESFALIGYTLSSEQTCTDEEVDVFLSMSDDILQILETIEPKTGYSLKLWDESMLMEIIPEKDCAPYAPLYFDVLDSTYAGYQNRTGDVFINLTEQGNLTQFFLKLADSANFYLGMYNEVVIGVKEGELCLISKYADGQVRDVINNMDAQVLFEIPPAVCMVNNSTTYFYYWKIDNGYIGFSTINGGPDPQSCYNAAVYSYILFEDLATINVVETTITQ